MRAVRKLLLIVVLVSLAAVPAALAASGKETERSDENLIESKLAGNPLESPTAKAHSRRAKRAAKRARAARVKAAVPPQLQAIAACESGGNPRAVSADGSFRGKYQFSPATWQAVGGKGDPAAAPEAEQDKRAAILYARSGPGQWPVCGA